MADQQPMAGRRQPGTMRLPVVFYLATIALELEQSRVSFNEQIDPARATAALTTPPPWSLSPWPPESRRPSTQLLAYALAKWKAFFDHAALVSDPHSTAQAIKESVSARFPWVQQALAGPKDSYRRFEVEASILDDGTVTWGFRTPAAGQNPPGLDDAGLELFIQNLVRADLQQRLEALGAV